MGPSGERQITKSIRKRIERGGERLWRLDDFKFSSSAVAQALSRLSRQGAIERLSKGVYYRARVTSFGKSRPNPAAIQNLAAKRTTVFPSGIAAANLLGFSTQTARTREVSTSAQSLPRKLLGSDTIIHTRRPTAWSELSQTDAALLDFLRGKGLTSELSPDETVKKLLELLAAPRRFETLLKVAETEPPRVRAILGAVGEALGKNKRALNRLRATLNSLSRFDFGNLTTLPHSRKWLAKERR